MKKSLPPVLNLFLLCVYIVMITYTSWQLLSELNLRYSANSTQGTVLGYETRISNAKFRWNRKPEHAPIVQFSTEKGEKVKVRSKVYETEKEYEVGDVMIVFYKVDDPTGAYVEGGFPWLGEIVLLLIGLFGVYYTVPPIMKRFRQHRKYI